MIKSRKGDNLVSGLNPGQAEAVCHIDGPLLILAGAGSGKTRVLVHRIAYLIREAGVPPWSILGITFTNKAAMEMKTRVAELLPDESSAIWISTFHSACVRILRRDIERIGFARGFSILDTADQLSLIKECLKDLGLSEKQVVPKAVLDQISKAKDEMKSPRDILNPRDIRAQRERGLSGGYGPSSNENDSYIGQVADIYELYQKKLKKLNALDFDDIILMTIKLLNECKDILDYYQNRFTHVLVDEYQDTNTAQYALISLLCGKWKNICVVGDDDQSIYGWRGANIGNILGFEDEYHSAKVIKLEQNYRSTKNILTAANSVIHKNTRRKHKNLWTENEEGEAIHSIKLENEHEEAVYVARIIKRLKSERGMNYNESAVLYRINAQSRVIENIFIREGVPYRIIGGFKFFDRKEIKDVIAYLRLLQNPADDISFKRVINVPRRGVGAATIERLESCAAEMGLSVFDAAEAVLQNPKDFPGLKSASVKLEGFIRMLQDLSGRADGLGTADILDLVLQRSGIIAMYEKDTTEEARARLENILEFKSEIIEFERNFESDETFYADTINGGGSNAAGIGAPGMAGADSGIFPKATLEDFLSHVSLISDIDSYVENDEKVSLMTMHSAKGLEYDSVFIIGAEEGVFPGTKSILFPTQLEEERRLCYVAITRAKKRLFITNAASRTLFGNTTYNRLSRFITDIPNNIISNKYDIDQGAQKTGYKEIRKTLFPIKNKNTYDPKNVFGKPPQALTSKGMPGRSGRGLPGVSQVERRIVPLGSQTGVMADAQAGILTDGYDNGKVYSIGDAVSHKKYGSGIVIDRRRDGSDFIIEIDFENAGMKRFIESMVKLKVEI